MTSRTATLEDFIPKHLRGQDPKDYIVTKAGEVLRKDRFKTSMDALAQHAGFSVSDYTVEDVVEYYKTRSLLQDLITWQEGQAGDISVLMEEHDMDMEKWLALTDTGALAGKLNMGLAAAVSKHFGLHV